MLEHVKKVVDSTGDNESCARVLIGKGWSYIPFNEKEIERLFYYGEFKWLNDGRLMRSEILSTRGTGD